MKGFLRSLGSSRRSSTPSPSFSPPRNSPQPLLIPSQVPAMIANRTIPMTHQRPFCCVKWYASLPFSLSPFPRLTMRHPENLLRSQQPARYSGTSSATNNTSDILRSTYHCRILTVCPFSARKRVRPSSAHCRDRRIESRRCQRSRASHPQIPLQPEQHPEPRPIQCHYAHAHFG
jgi:hypothetical protein